MLTLQETFDKVATHLLRQNARSESATTCLYRGPNGLKCAVGCLIDDAVYSPEIEGFAVKDVACIKSALRKSGVPTGRKAMDLLVNLQVLHDRFQPVLWREELAKIATDFDLKMTEYME